MGLKNVEALRSFCLELSSEAPSPGGGTASAAAGAMAASLLMMVCGITAKSKRHEPNKERLEALKGQLSKRRDELIDLSREDARAYDLVVEAMRKNRESENKESIRAVQNALKFAAEIPMNTATKCAEVLEASIGVAELGTKSASSDVGVAVLLAEAGFKGASMNVRINLKDIRDSEFVESAKERLASYDRRVSDLTTDALGRLGKLAQQ
jgi:formiminotetrahydrofolate cyclodeaminase